MAKLLEGKIDEESLAAKCRLQSCSDLPAVDARYHIKCKNKLNVASVRSPPNSANRGRPRNQLIEVNYDRYAACSRKKETSTQSMSYLIK